MMLNMDKDKLVSEYRKLEENKIKSGQILRRKNEINEELETVESYIT
jgi:hypothetical protein